MQPVFEAPYPAECGFRAAEIVTRLLPYVRLRAEYVHLGSVLSSRERWHEAHDAFSRIRVGVTLVRERQRPVELTADDLFMYIAENAAKTAFNCTLTDAPFDDDSYDYLLRLAQDFDSRSFSKPAL
jgi:hypothetical protein